MPYSLVTCDMRSGYVSLVNAVRHSSSSVAPRGQRTLELSDVLITLTDPTRAIPYDVGRKLNMSIASAEFIQLLGGYSDVDQLAMISPVFKNFTDHGRLRGAYGPRLHHQWPHLLQRLVDDPDTRQAVATIWTSSELMNAPPLRDMPCTISLSYTIRDGALDARTHMRSNDLWLGTPYDFGQFTALQRTLAWVLGVPVGNYTHFVNSLHLYESSLEAAANVKLLPTTNDRDLMPPITYEVDEEMSVQARWDLVQSLARRIGLGTGYESDGVHLARLEKYPSIMPICHRCRYTYDADPTSPFHNICNECSF